MKTLKTLIPDVLISLFAIGLLALLATACGDNSTNADPEPPADIQITSTQSHGEVLADSEGNILYFFTRDVSGESKCEGQCIGMAPVYYFAGDEVRGDTRGVSVPEPGVWPVIQEDTPPAHVPEDNDSDNTDPNNDDGNNDDGNGDDGY